MGNRHWLKAEFLSAEVGMLLWLEAGMGNSSLVACDSSLANVGRSKYIKALRRRSVQAELEAARAGACGY